MNDASTPTRLGLRAAPWLLWYGVLGGATAWSLHMIVDWGIDETVCRSGNTSMVGVPLRPLLLGLVLFFLLLAIGSAVVAYRHWRTLDSANEAEEFSADWKTHDIAPGQGESAVLALRRRRASFMALVGLVIDVLFILMLAFSVAATLVLPVCAGLP
jgi:hypothetical protein